MIGMMKGDMGILLQMLRGRSRSGSHQQQLEEFYHTQAGNYDAFRSRLLHGRRELIDLRKSSKYVARQPENPRCTSEINIAR